MDEHAIAFLITVSAGALIAILTWLLNKRGGLSAALLCGAVISLFPVAYVWRSWRPAVPAASPSFANFNGCALVTDSGHHWGVFGDYPSGGRSTVTPSIASDGPNQCHLVLQYALDASPPISPYCGVYAGFSAHPAVPRDVSGYRGIQLEIWSPEPPPPEVAVYLELSPLATIDSYDGFFRYALTPHVGSGARRLVQAPFDAFSPSPKLPEPRMAFTKKLQEEVYQVAIVITGKDGAGPTRGAVLVDNIQVY